MSENDKRVESVLTYFYLKANTTSSGGKRHVFHPLARCGG